MPKYLRGARPLLTTLLAALVPLAGVLTWAAAQTVEPLRIVATVGMLGEPAARIAGECAEVDWLMGSGVDPHLYQASARDVRTLQQAELILYAGLSLEGQLGEVLAGFSRRVPTVAVSEELAPPERLIRTDDQYGVDPHLWMDVGLWSLGVPVMAEAIAELRPDCAATVEANASAYLLELQALDEWVRQAIATLPQEQRILITAHDAFAYYGRAYGIEVAGIQGISTEAEAGVADIRETARLVAEREVPALFVESTINPRTVQAVVEAARSLGFEVALGPQLYSDAMGEAGTADGTYIGMIHRNTVNIVTSLGGEVPPLPEELETWARHWGIR